MRLNPLSYSERVISAVLLVEEDGKPENYIVTPTGDLVNIDNDQALSPPITKNGDIVTLLHLTSVYCFDEMLQPVAPAIVEQFKNLDIYQFLKVWLTELRQLNDRFMEMFSPSECQRQFTYQADNPILVPIPLNPMLVETMWKRLSTLQRLFRNNPCPTHMELLEAVHPEVASYYKRAFRTPGTPFERFTALSKRTYTQIKNQTEVVEHFGTISNSKQTVQSIFGQIPNMSTLASCVGIDGHDALQKLEEIRIRRQSCDEIRREIKSGNLDKFRELEDLEIKEILINGDSETEIERIDISASEQKVQVDLLKAMAGVNWTKLLLGGCQFLNDTLLEALLTHSKSLVILDLSKCTQITSKIIVKLPKLCPNLQVLNLSHLMIETLEFKTQEHRLKKLKRLHLDDCSQLSTVNLKCRELNYLSIRRCTNLEHLEAFTRQSHIIFRLEGMQHSDTYKRGLVVIKEGNKKSIPWTLVCNGKHPMVGKMLQEQITVEGIEKFIGYKGINYDTPNKDGLTLLHLTILSKWPNKYDMIKRLLALGASPNCLVTSENKHYKKMNALHLAVEMNDTNDGLWEDFAGAKAKFNALNADFFTPLFQACAEHNRSGLVQKLLQNPAINLNYRSPKKGLTVLHLAATRSTPDEVKALIARRANPLATTDDGCSPFESACILERLDNARVFIEHGAPISLQRVDGRTALHQVCDFGLDNVVQFLIEYGINLNIRDHKGETALHIACKKANPNISIIQRLLDAFADPTIGDNTGVTAKSIIESRKLLVTFKEPPNRKDRHVVLMEP